MAKAFVSYSWDSDDHKAWVAQLAARLRADGVDVILDQWHVVPGDQLPEFMERAVRESDFVLIVCTKKYKERSDNRSGGVGYEGDIMSGEILTQRNQRKFIPILRQRPWAQVAPSWLTGKYYIDLSENPYLEDHYADLLTTVLGTRQAPPPIGHPVQDPQVQPTSIGIKQPRSTSPTFEPIRILGVIVDEVGTPRNDGTLGSGLYNVPFRISRQPPHEWVDLFVEAWNHPPRFTTIHRPGIASVRGTTIHLDGTTIDEVQKYHRETLILAIQEANANYLQLLAQQMREQQQEQQRIEKHKQGVKDAAKNIRFDD